MTARPGARLIGLKQAESEYGLPYGLLYSLVKSGELKSVTPPGVRRIYLDRVDVDAAIARWKEADRG